MRQSEIGVMARGSLSIVGSRLGLVIGLALWGCARASAAPASRLVTSSGVGPVKLGMTVAQARRALARSQFKRGSDGEGVALIEVVQGGRVVMTLFADEPDRARPINERARVSFIEVWGKNYATRAGVRPGMLIREVERRYGRLKQITTSEIEQREYAEFARAPAGLGFRVEAPGSQAGRYRSGSRTTTRYVPSARLLTITISR